MQQSSTLGNGQPAAPKDIPVEFGLGLWREQWGKRTVLRLEGIWGGFRSGVYRIPEERFSVISLCNRSDPDPNHISRQIAEIFYPGLSEEHRVPARQADAAEAVEPTIGEEQLKAVEGIYRSEELDAVYRLEVRDGKLHAHVGHIDLTLSPVSKTQFRSGPFILTVTTTGLRIDVDDGLFGIHDLNLSRVK